MVCEEFRRKQSLTAEAAEGRREEFAQSHCFKEFSEHGALVLHIGLTHSCS